MNHDYTPKTGEQDALPNDIPAQAPRTRQRVQARRTRWLAVSALGAALAVGTAGGIGWHNAQAAGSGTSSSSSGTPPVVAATGGPARGPGHGPGRGPKGDLTVSSVSGSTITAKRADGTSTTIDTSSSTVFHRAGATVSLSAVTSGEHIHVRGTRSSSSSSSNNTITATAVDIVLPSYRGVVTAISGSTITVQDHSGTHTIDVGSSTTYMRAGQSASLSDIKTGDHVGAEGTLNSSGVLSAEAVHIDLPHVGGQITTISGNVITVTDPRGTHTIDVSSGTKYFSGPTTSTSLSSLKTGENINAEGTLESNGTLNAVDVHVGPARPMPAAGGPAMGGHMRGQRPAPNGAAQPNTNGTPGSSSSTAGPNGTSQPGGNSTATPNN